MSRRNRVHPNGRKACVHCGTRFDGYSATRFCSQRCSLLSLKVERSAEDRFWEKVNKDGPVPSHCPELGPCWVWIAGLNEHGYGSFIVNGSRRPGRKSALAHRVSYDMAHPDAPSTGSNVLHKCDTPVCVRPDHLFLGSLSENVADMVRKNRVSHGTAHWRAKLTDDAVKDIRRRHSSGESIRSLARHHGVSFAAVNQVLIGRTWRRVPMEGT